MCPQYKWHLCSEVIKYAKAATDVSKMSDVSVIESAGALGQRVWKQE